MIIPLASNRNYKKVIKIDLTTALNSEIIHSLVHWFPNGGLGFRRSGNPTISSQIHNAFHYAHKGEVSCSRHSHDTTSKIAP
jgi:hypothetical protein